HGDGQLGGREHRILDRGNVGRPHKDRPVGVGADLHVVAVLPLVHEGIHVADDEVLNLDVRLLLEEANWADADQLMNGRGEADGRPGHLRQLRAPDAGANDDVFGLYVAAVGAHAGDTAVLGEDVVDLCVGEDGERA